jgi:hypothetical protein
MVMSQNRQLKHTTAKAAVKFYNIYKVDCIYFYVHYPEKFILLKKLRDVMKKLFQKGCRFFKINSEEIKDRTGSGEDYTDTYNYCTELKRRISKKTSCNNCNLFKNVNND